MRHRILFFLEQGLGVSTISREFCIMVLDIIKACIQLFISFTEQVYRRITARGRSSKIWKTTTIRPESTSWSGATGGRWLRPT